MLFSSNQIREYASESHGAGNFQSLMFHILADITERLDIIEKKLGPVVPTGE